MKTLRTLIILAALLSPSLSLAQWTNEPSGSSVLLDCDFTSLSQCGLLDVYNSTAIVTDATDPISPSSVARHRLEAFATTGGGQVHYTYSPASREIYVGKVWRVNAGWQGRIVQDKLFFVRGPANNGYWGFKGGPTKGGPMFLFWGHNSGNLDNSHICGGPPGLGSGGNCDPNVSSGSVGSPGTWAKIEIYQKCSTTTTSRDGIVRWWINGTLAGNYTTVNNCANGLNEWVWSETWDGSGDMGTSNTVVWDHYIGHLRISIPNCPQGCATTGGGTTPPPPSPPPPSPPPPPVSSGNYVFQSQYSGTQGAGQWSYRDTAGNLLTYNSGTNLWNGIQSYQGLWSNGFHPGTSNGTVLRWTAPEAGTATIGGSAQRYDLACGDGITFQVKYNGSTTLFSQSIGVSDGTAYPYNVSQAMTTGQTIDFIVTPGATNSCDSAALNPVIAWAPTSGSAPTVSGLSPTSGAVGSSVTITGTNFIPSLSGNTVKFSNIAATVTAATTTSITATVPPHALTGTVSVTTTLGTGTSAGSFTVPLSGVVETVGDVSASATGTSSVQVQFTALSDGTGAAAKHDVRMAAGTISWGDASSVASGTCSTPYAPAAINTVVTCTITGLSTGTQYDVQLVPYRGTINVDAVYGNISNIATVTTMGTIIDVPVICSRPYGEALPVAYTCPKPPRELTVSR